MEYSCWVLTIHLERVKEGGFIAVENTLLNATGLNLGIRQVQLLHCSRSILVEHTADASMRSVDCLRNALGSDMVDINFCC